MSATSKNGVQVITSNLKFPQSHFFSFSLDHFPIAVASYFTLSGGKRRPCKMGTIANQSAIAPIPTVKAKVRGFQLYALFVLSSIATMCWRRHCVELSAQVAIQDCRISFAVKLRI
jgi:hypothetical protein